MEEKGCCLFGGAVGPRNSGNLDDNWRTALATVESEGLALQWMKQLRCFPSDPRALFHREAHSCGGAKKALVMNYALLEVSPSILDVVALHTYRRIICVDLSTGVAAIQYKKRTKFSQ